MAVKKRKGLKELIHYWLLQIELVTCMYVMDPIEKGIFLAVLVLVLALLFFAAWKYFFGQLFFVLSLSDEIHNNQFEPST